MMSYFDASEHCSREWFLLYALRSVFYALCFVLQREMWSQKGLLQLKILA